MSCTQRTPFIYLVMVHPLFVFLDLLSSLRMIKYKLPFSWEEGPLWIFIDIPNGLSKATGEKKNNAVLDLQLCQVMWQAGSGAFFLSSAVEDVQKPIF